MSDLDTKKALVGWKEIARFFARTESTVKRWEGSRGLPIHRVPGTAGATVFAYEVELREWLKGEPQTQDGETTTSASSPRRTLWSASPAAMLAATLFLAGAIYLSVAGQRSGTAAEVATSSDKAATQLYKTALFEWQTRTPTGLTYAVKDFKAAIARDPNYAMAYVGLADSYNLMREYTAMRPDVAYPQAKSAAERAISLNPAIAEAHAALAFDDFYWSRDEANARRQFEIALALKPDSAVIHHWYANFLMTVRAFPKALQEIDEAAHLDPESTAILADKGLILLNAGKPGEAAALLQRLEATQPQFLSPHKYLVGAYLASGDDRAFVRELETTARMRNDSRELRVADAARDGFQSHGHSGMLFAMLETQKQLYRDGRQSAYEMALAYANVGDEKNAMEYLKVSLARHEPENIAMAVAPSFAQLRGQADFRTLLVSAGLTNAS
jgi:Tfp pilus assembly protein PilF